jgi:hypothetical protein
VSRERGEGSRGQAKGADGLIRFRFRFLFPSLSVSVSLYLVLKPILFFFVPVFQR